MHAIERLILTSLPTIEYNAKREGSEPILWMGSAPRRIGDLHALKQIAEIEAKIEHFGFSVLLLEDEESDKLMQKLVASAQEALDLGRGIPSLSDLNQLGILTDAIRSDLDRQLFSPHEASA